MRHFYISKTPITRSAKFLLMQDKVIDERSRGQVGGMENSDPSERETAFRLKELRFYLGDDILVLTVYNCGVLCRRKM